jgi:hypothetical protein
MAYLRSFVAMGIGMAFLPASTVKDDIAAERLVQIHSNGLPELMRHTSVIYLRDRYRSAATREFIEEITTGRSMQRAVHLPGSYTLPHLSDLPSTAPEDHIKQRAQEVRKGDNHSPGGFPVGRLISNTIDESPDPEH